MATVQQVAYKRMPLLTEMAHIAAVRKIAGGMKPGDATPSSVVIKPEDIRNYLLHPLTLGSGDIFRMLLPKSAHERAFNNIPSNGSFVLGVYDWRNTRLHPLAERVLEIAGDAADQGASFGYDSLDVLAAYADLCSRDPIFVDNGITSDMVLLEILSNFP